MRYPASEKLEIIRLVEQSDLPVRRTLAKIGILPAAFYRWYGRYQTGGPVALEDRSSKPKQVWNRIPDALDHPRSGHHRNRYGPKHASHDRPRYPRRHRVAREGVARTHFISSRLANLPPCLIGIEAGMATHYVARELAALGHDVKQVPPTYAKPFRQGHKMPMP